MSFLLPFCRCKEQNLQHPTEAGLGQTQPDGGCSHLLPGGAGEDARPWLQQNLHLVLLQCPREVRLMGREKARQPTR